MKIVHPFQVCFTKFVGVNFRDCRLCSVGGVFIVFEIYYCGVITYFSHICVYKSTPAL